MNMLKKQSLKRVILGVIFLCVIGGFMLAIIFPSLVNALKKPVTLAEINYLEDIEGIHVRDTVYGIYDYYCEETENYSDVVAREYFIDANDFYYIGMRAEHRKMTKADELLYATERYFEGTDDGTELMEAQYIIDGVIKAMPYDSKEYYYEAADWYGINREVFLPYYVEDGSYGAYDTFDLVFISVIVIAAFGGAILLLVWAVTGHYQKSVKKYLNSSPNAEFAASKVENFLVSVPLEDGMRYNHEFLCGSSGPTTVFGETQKLAWAYKHIVTHKRNFITVSKDYSVVLGFTDGTIQRADVKNEEIADKHLEKLSKLCPKALFDYSTQLEKMFEKDLSGFLAIKYNVPEQDNDAETETAAE